MLVRFTSDATVVFTGEADCIPPPGCAVEFRMAVSVAEAAVGKLVEAIVSRDKRTRYDYDTLAPQVVVYVPVHSIIESFE